MPLPGKNEAAAQEQNSTDAHQKGDDSLPGNNNEYCCCIPTEFLPFSRSCIFPFPPESLGAPGSHNPSIESREINVIHDSSWCAWYTTLAFLV